MNFTQILDEASTPTGHIFLKFGYKPTGKKDQYGDPVIYPVAWAGFANSPSQVQWGNARLKFTKLHTANDIVNIVKTVLGDDEFGKVFLSAKNLIIVPPKKSMDDAVSQFISWVDKNKPDRMELYMDNEGEPVPKIDNRVEIKREKKTNPMLGKDIRKVDAADPNYTVHFTVSDRFYNAIRKNMPNLMQYKGAGQDFRMPQQLFNQFRDAAQQRFGDIGIRVIKKAHTSEGLNEATYDVSYDHGPHQSNTIRVKAESEKHAWEVAKKEAAEKHHHTRIMAGRVTQVKDDVKEDSEKNNAIRNFASDEFQAKSKKHGDAVRQAKKFARYASDKGYYKLDEIGDTPAGQKSLGAVKSRAFNKMAAASGGWMSDGEHDPKTVSKYSKVEKQANKRLAREESELNERSTSEKQARTMAAAAHDPKFAKKVGIKQSVAKEFNKADKGTKQLSNAMKKKNKKTDEGIADTLGTLGGAGLGYYLGGGLGNPMGVLPIAGALGGGYLGHHTGKILGNTFNEESTMGHESVAHALQHVEEMIQHLMTTLEREVEWSLSDFYGSQTVAQLMSPVNQAMNHILQFCEQQMIRAGQDPEYMKESDGVLDESGEIARLMQAYAETQAPDNYDDDAYEKGEQILNIIRAKYGDEIAAHAEDHAHASNWGRHSIHSELGSNLLKRDPLKKTDPMRITKSGIANRQDQKTKAGIIKNRLGKHVEPTLPEMMAAPSGPQWDQNGGKHAYESRIVDMDDDDFWLMEAGKASKAYCKANARKRENMGASQLSSCISQGYLPHKSGKSVKIADRRVKLNGIKLKGEKYGGPKSTKAGE